MVPYNAEYDHCIMSLEVAGDPRNVCVLDCFSCSSEKPVCFDLVVIQTRRDWKCT